jgi:hypothetical protein
VALLCLDKGGGAALTDGAGGGGHGHGAAEDSLLKKSVFEMRFVAKEEIDT